jgi:hypothetical protein
MPSKAARETFDVPSAETQVSFGFNLDAEIDRFEGERDIELLAPIRMIYSIRADTL